MVPSTYEQVLQEVQQLTPEEQDRLIQDLQEARATEDDARWEAAFARSQDKLEVAAARVRANRAAGRRIALESDQA
jgi:hypothetical protein